MDDVRIPRANEDSPDNDQETLQVLRPDGTLGESDEDMEARLAMESLMRHRRARRRKKLIAGGIVGAIVLVGAIAWGVSKFTGNAGGDDAPQLMTTFVDRGDFTEAVEASGAAKPVTSVVVNPEVGGTIETVNVAEGDTVQEGDVQNGCFLAGQIAAMVKKEQPAAEIIREVMQGAEPILKGAAQWIK